MLSDQIMMPSLKKRWQVMRDDAKATLETAFRDGITFPCIVPVHFCYTRVFLNLVIEFHHFRVGYATFMIALIDGYSAILYDLWLDDGLPLYPI
jgi:hypothetical protein